MRKFAVSKRKQNKTRDEENRFIGDRATGKELWLKLWLKRL